MDKIILNLNTDKRVFTVGISQSMNIGKLVDDYIEMSLNDKVIYKLYVGSDRDYIKTINFDASLLDHFVGRLVSPYDMKFTQIKEIPQCDVMFVYLDTFVDYSIIKELLMSVGYTTKIIYLHDNMLVDYSDGEFYRKHHESDCIINTFNRRPDAKFQISALLNKLKKYKHIYITDSELQAPSTDDYNITYEEVKDENLLDYDKIILVNHDDVSEYNVRVRKILARPFAPVERDKMINYTPMCVTATNMDTDEVSDIDIPIYSDLIVLSQIREPDFMVAPIYRFKYIKDDTEYEFETIISTAFIHDLNNNSVPLEDGDKLSHQGYKLYYSYAIPLYAVSKRYDNPLLVVSDDIINKSLVYTAIRFAKNRFDLVYDTNVYIGQ